jgi:hypothetical protein
LKIGSLVAGVVGSVLGGGFVTWFFHRRASKAPGRAKEDIVGVQGLTLRALEERGDVVLARDASGRITGLQLTKPVEVDTVLGSDSATASVNSPGSGPTEADSRAGWMAPAQDETPPPKIP